MKKVKLPVRQGKKLPKATKPDLKKAPAKFASITQPPDLKKAPAKFASITQPTVPAAELQAKMQAAVQSTVQDSGTTLEPPGRYVGGTTGAYGFNPVSPSMRADIVPSSEMRNLIASTKLFDRRNNLSEPPEGLTELGKALYSQCLKKMSDTDRATCYAQGGLDFVREVVMERAQRLTKEHLYVRQGSQQAQRKGQKAARRKASRPRSRKRPG